jgi:hypothetical protein
VGADYGCQLAELAPDIARGYQKEPVNYAAANKCSAMNFSGSKHVQKHVQILYRTPI